MPTERRYFKEMRFRQLRALVELARHKTFSAVASELGLSVSSTWQQVRALEEEFDVQLVAAKGQHVSRGCSGQPWPGKKCASASLTMRSIMARTGASSHANGNRASWRAGSCSMVA